MTDLPKWRRYLRFRGPNVRADVDDELEFHIQTRAEELVRTGLAPGAARTRAVAEMGDLGAARRECVAIGERENRKQRLRDWLETRGQDARLAVRALRRSPSFATVAIFTLALSIGATTAIFSIVDGVLIRPLRLADPDRLVSLFETNRERGIDQEAPSGPNLLDWRKEARSFSGMAAYRFESFTLTSGSSPDMMHGAGVSANLFDVLGVPPLLGRGFRRGEDEAGGARVIVLSYGAWQRRFGGTRETIGRVLILDRKPFEVVGVMPRGFAFPSHVEAWRPADLSRAASSVGLGEEAKEARQARYLGAIARLRPGVTQRQAEQEMATIATALARAYPVDDGGWSTKVVPLRDAVVGEVERLLLLLFAAVGLVLLMACANVANLTLGRAIAREPEMALRAALGAGRGRLHLQMLTESVVVALIGGTLGVGFAWAGVRTFLGLAPATLPRLDEVKVDASVLLFALVVSVLTGLLFGVVPSLRVAGARAEVLLREAGRGRVSGRRSDAVRRTLVVGEVALAMLLLVGAGLTLRSVLRILAVDPGYATENVIAARVNLDGERYRGNIAKASYLREVTGRIAAIPGVQRVGVTTTLPLTPSGIDFDLAYVAEGHPVVDAQKAPRVDYRMISPGYLEATGIRLRYGRAFTEFDRIDRDVQAPTDSTIAIGGHKVMLVNETFARRNWPTENALGKHVRLYYFRSDVWEVVGVVADTRHAELLSPPRPQVFVPVDQAELLFGFMTIVARTKPGADDVEPAMRDVAVSVDPSEPLYDIDTIEALRAQATVRDRLTAAVFGSFALIAVVLAAAGIYGVIAYQVARRTREIGVRIALGASRARVVRDVVREASGLALSGIALGCVGAFAGARLARGMLFGVEPTDPLTFGAVALLLLAVAITAALVPAARAAGIQPVEALRSD
jgi:predicted permease